MELEGTLFRCEMSTQRTDIGLCDQLFDLMNSLDLLWDEGEDATSSVGDSPGVFPQNWLPPHLSYTGLLEVTGFRFDAIVRSSYRAAELVRFVYTFRYITNSVRCHGGWRRDPYDNGRALVGR